MHLGMMYSRVCESESVNTFVKTQTVIEKLKQHWTMVFDFTQTLSTITVNSWTPPDIPILSISCISLKPFANLRAYWMPCRVKHDP